MSTSKVNTATEADWSFLEDPRAADAVTQAARKLAREFEAVVDPEDAYQDCALWLSVRPEMVAKARETDNYGQLYQDIYGNLRKPALRAAGAAARTVSRDAVELNEVSW